MDDKSGSRRRFARDLSVEAVESVLPRRSLSAALIQDKVAGPISPEINYFPALLHVGSSKRAQFVERMTNSTHHVVDKKPSQVELSTTKKWSCSRQRETPTLRATLYPSRAVELPPAIATSNRQLLILHVSCSTLCTIFHHGANPTWDLDILRERLSWISHSRWTTI